MNIAYALGIPLYLLPEKVKIGPLGKQAKGFGHSVTGEALGSHDYERAC